ncbi:hypothetical protein HDU96_009384 [Phlyctochytrium bullatum]|nr:hypothetical protein HDU96_009384 [Phlyctochytrium bullatum]
MFRPSNSELGFALTHINRHFVIRPKKNVDQHQQYDDYLSRVPFHRLPPVYALSMLFSGRLAQEYWDREMVVTWITNRRFGITLDEDTPRKGPESTKARIERLFKTALALDWEVADATVALGGASMDKNLFLELLAEIAAAIDSLTALDVLLDLVIEKVPYDYVAKNDKGGGKQIPGSDKTTVDHHPEDAAIPDILHVALYAAGKYGSETIVRYLLDYFPEEFVHLMDRVRLLGYPRPLFYLAARTQKIVKDNVNKESPPSEPDPDIYDPDRYDQDLSARDSFTADTALHVVKSPEIMSLLLEHGADPMAAGSDMESPIHRACKRIGSDGGVSMIAILLKHGADAAEDPGIGRVPLHYALKARGGTASLRLQGVRLLLESGADAKVNNPDYRGRTPLHYACKFDSDEMFKLLVNYGADINLVDARGRTPLDVLRQYAIRRCFGDVQDSSSDEELSD